MTVILNPSQFHPVARELTQGIRIDKAAATVTTSAVPLFTVTGGRVLVIHIIGEVTATIVGTTPTLKLSSDPTTGTTSDICTATAIDADEIGTLYAIDGVGNALETGSSGAVESSAKAVVVPIGSVTMTGVGVGIGGSVKWSMIYVPLDAGAEVAAAV